MNARDLAVPNAAGSQVSRISCFAAMAAGVLFLLLLSVRSSAQANIINTYAGGGTPSSAPLSIDLPGPTAAIRDTAGNTYFTAPYTSDVFELSASSGLVTVFAGTGTEGYGGDGGQANLATLALPSGLAIDSKGNIYIADFGNPRIRMVAPNGIITTVAGNGIRCEPSTGTCGDGGPATSASFNFPLGVAIDAAGNLYVADAFDNRIRKVDAATNTITTFAGNGVPCAKATGACGDGGSPIGPTLNYPQSIAFDSAGNLYIADTRDNRIRKISAGGTPTITTVAGTGAICQNPSAPSAPCGDGGLATAAHLTMPMGIFVDSSANIYIADTYDQKIRLVNATTQNISTFAGTGTQAFAGDSGLATAADLDYPQSVFLDGSANLLIADQGNLRIRQVSSGNISTIAGGGMGNDNGPALNAILADPYNVNEDSNGILYIADTANNRIRAVNTGTQTAIVLGVTIPAGYIATVVGTGFAGYTGDGGPALMATLDGPTDVALDGAGDLFIADASNLVIREVNASTFNIKTYAGTGNACPLGNPTNPCGDNGPATLATFTYPLAIALDSLGNLYIADYDVHRVREVNAGTQIITTIAGVGIAGAGGNGKPAIQAHLDHPSGVAVDSSFNVYIADSYNNEIRRITASTGIINDWALNGLFVLGGDGGPATGGSMWSPNQLAIDAANDVFIGGGNDNIVQRVSAATNIIGTVAGDYAQKGVGGFSGDGGPAASAKLANDGLMVDAKNNLYIADAGNNRIRLVQLSPGIGYTTPSNFASYPIGTASPAQNVTISSIGGLDLSLSGLSFGGNNPQDFAETTTCGNGTLPALISVDVTCTVAVTFTPVNYGKRTATLQFTDNSLTSPQSVNLVGFGPYFTIANSPTSLKILPGSSNQTTVTVTPFGQFSGAVNLSCSGLPADTTCSFATNPATPSGGNVTSVLTVQTTSGAPGGTYVITVTGAFGPQSQLQWSAQLQLIIK